MVDCVFASEVRRKQDEDKLFGQMLRLTSGVGRESKLRPTRVCNHEAAIHSWGTAGHRTLWSKLAGNQTSRNASPQRSPRYPVWKAPSNIMERAIPDYDASKDPYCTIARHRPKAAMPYSPTRPPSQADSRRGGATTLFPLTQPVPPRSAPASNQTSPRVPTGAHSARAPPPGTVAGMSEANQRMLVHAAAAPRPPIPSEEHDLQPKKPEYFVSLRVPRAVTNYNLRLELHGQSRPRRAPASPQTVIRIHSPASDAPRGGRSKPQQHLCDEGYFPQAPMPSPRHTGGFAAEVLTTISRT